MTSPLMTRLRHLALALAVGATAEAQSIGLPTVVVDGSGRILRTDSTVTGPVRIQFPATYEVRVCAKTFSLNTHLRATRYSGVAEPTFLLSATPEKGAREGASQSVSIPAGQSGFIAYNVIAEPLAGANADTQTAACRRALTAAQEARKAQKGLTNDAERTVTNLTAELARLRDRLKSEEQDAAAFAGMPSAVEQVAAVLRSLTARRDEIEAKSRALHDAQQALDAARVALVAATDATPDEVLVDGLERGLVLTMGGVVVGRHRAGIYYDFSAFGPGSQMRLMPLGTYPRLYFEDSVTVAIVNVDRSAHPYGFTLDQASTVGAVATADPVTPSATAPTWEMALYDRPKNTPSTREDPPLLPVTERAFVSVFLPLNGAFPPNAIPEVSIFTERPSATDPAKLETVTLVEKVRYPQFRAKYHYAVTTGAFFSGLRSHAFSKVKVTPDNPDTKDVDESAYRTDRVQTGRQARPAVAVSFSIPGVDVQRNCGRDCLIPFLTLGFGLTSPKDDVFLGASFTPRRNLFLFIGAHRGVVKSVVPRDEVTEQANATPPETVDRATWSWSTGLSFNFPFITQLFK